MGRIKSFFSKVGEGVKRGATKVFQFGKGIVEKSGHIIRPAVDIAGKVSGVLSHLPGTVGTVGKAFSKGIDYVKGITNMLPNSKAKDIINSATNKIDDKGRSLIDKGQRYAIDVKNKTIPWVDAGIGIVKKVGGG